MAKRRGYSNSFYVYESSGPINAREGIKARSQHGAFAQNWWAQRWIDAMERLVDSARLTRGRNYARRGQVLSIEERKNGIEAKVQGSRRTPYRVSIEVGPISDAQWEEVIDALAEQAIFAAQLLVGEMPRDIEEVFNAVKVDLFPTRRSDLMTNCSCPDWANPCKHVAATHYILGERFDEDPFLLFRMRGRTQEQIMEALRKRRVGHEAVDDEEEEVDEPESFIPLEETLSGFWDPSIPAQNFGVQVRPAPIEIALLKRLGEPSFAAERSFSDLMLPAYQYMARMALETAYGSPRELEEEENNKNGAETDGDA